MLEGGNMKIPAEVKILFTNYKVVDELNIHDEKSDLYGQINYLNQIIKLNPQAKDEQKKSTFLHECVHGLDEMFSIGLTEEQVEKLGTALYTFIESNEDIFK